MTPNAAFKLLVTAPVSNTEYSNVVSNYTELEFTKTIVGKVRSHHKHVGKTKALPAALIKQVYQAVKNMPHPRYNKAA